MKVFVSSVQNELAEERRAVKTFIESDPLLRRPQRTANRDLNELVEKGIIELEGKGRGAQYRLLRNRAIITPNAQSENG